MSRFLDPLKHKPLRTPLPGRVCLLRQQYGLWTCLHPDAPAAAESGMDLETLLTQLARTDLPRTALVITDLMLDLPLEEPPGKGIRPREFQEVLRWELPVLLDRHPDSIPPEWPRHSEHFHFRAYALPDRETRVGFLPGEIVLQWESKLRRKGFALEGILAEPHLPEPDAPATVLDHGGRLPWLLLQPPKPNQAPALAAAALVLLGLTLWGAMRVSHARREVNQLQERLDTATRVLGEKNQLWQQGEEGLEERRARQSERDRLRAQLQRVREDSLTGAWPRHHQPEYHARLLRGLSTAFPGEPALLRHATDPRGRILLSGHTRHDGYVRAAHLRLLNTLEGETPPELLFTSAPDLSRPGRLLFQTDPRDLPPPMPSTAPDES